MMELDAAADANLDAEIETAMAEYKISPAKKQRLEMQADLHSIIIESTKETTTIDVEDERLQWDMQCCFGQTQSFDKAKSAASSRSLAAQPPARSIEAVVWENNGVFTFLFISFVPDGQYIILSGAHMIQGLRMAVVI